MLGPVELVAEVDSTNRVLVERARAGAPAGAVLVADHQTAGRGRLDRRWEAEPGAALLVSVLLRPDLDASQLHGITMAASLAAVAACRQVGAVGVAVKWPNDLVTEDGKLAGLLAEAVLDGARVAAVVVGMGMNLHGAPEGGVALDDLAGRRVERETVLAAWLGHFEERLAEPMAALLAAYREACSTLGRAVRVVGQDGETVGTAVEVDDSGRLVVESDGVRRAFAVGDVVHVRTAVSG